MQWAMNGTRRWIPPGKRCCARSMASSPSKPRDTAWKWGEFPASAKQTGVIPAKAGTHWFPSPKSSWPDLIGPSTYSLCFCRKDVDGRVKPGHDEGGLLTIQATLATFQPVSKLLSSRPRPHTSNPRSRFKAYARRRKHWHGQFTCKRNGRCHGGLRENQHIALLRNHTKLGGNAFIIIAETACTKSRPDIIKEMFLDLHLAACTVSGTFDEAARRRHGGCQCGANADAPRRPHGKICHRPVDPHDRDFSFPGCLFRFISQR